MKTLSKFSLSLLAFSLSISVISSDYISKNDANKLTMLVHKTPTCGCCKMWVEHIKEKGFIANIKDHDGLLEIKEKYKIQPQYRSCHTAVSKEGYVFEGHIPSKYIKKFLSEDHPNAIGLSVPGMPLGSPGMEVDDLFTPYDVLILFKDGSSKVFAEVRK